MKAAGQHQSTANHPGDLEVRQAFVIEHAVKFPERDETEHAAKQLKRELVTGKGNN